MVRTDQANLATANPNICPDPKVSDHALAPVHALTPVVDFTPTTDKGVMSEDEDVLCITDTAMFESFQQKNINSDYKSLSPQVDSNTVDKNGTSPIIQKN